MIPTVTSISKNENPMMLIQITTAKTNVKITTTTIKTMTIKKENSKNKEMTLIYQVIQVKVIMMTMKNISREI